MLLPSVPLLISYRKLDVRKFKRSFLVVRLDTHTHIQTNVSPNVRLQASVNKTIINLQFKPRHNENMIATMYSSLQKGKVLTGRLAWLREETQNYTHTHASAHSKARGCNLVAHIHNILLKMINEFTSGKKRILRIRHIF
jgi:hypothetical protein